MRVSLKIIIAAVTSTSLCFATVTMFGGQNDPGIRRGPAGAGQALAGLPPQSPELAFFSDPGLSQFTQVEAVTDGLGPRFNLDSCAGCHIFPAVGGSSPAADFISPDGTRGNPQVGRQPIMAPGSTVPPFLAQNGPVREVRFVRNSNGTPDGGVHGIFTIAGRSDARGCAISQPDFSNTGNMIFRIPTPVFGAGLIESITDTTIKNNLASDPFPYMKQKLGIKGHVNTNGNDGTVTRFGWKAQNKSLLIFAGEAYNVEMGITNENFPQEREEDPNCATNGLAENHTDFANGNGPADIVAFMGFMRFLDQPTPHCGADVGLDCSSVSRGASIFQNIGCATCHTPSLTTGLSPVAALNQQKANVFSDLAVHHMGGLADGVAQGSAGPDEFRTAPLWGLGQRAFFLHDGRATDLVQAILSHDIPAPPGFPASEAHTVIANYFQFLRPTDKQDLLNFLRSL